jgi:hypothetical protein
VRRLALLVAAVPGAFALALSAGACQRTEQVPAADCNAVAETLATFELGPTGTPEQRVPVVAKHKAGCEATHTTRDEAACLGRAKDTWAARACLPRMFSAPANTAGGTGATGAGSARCATAGERMRAAVMSEVGSNGSAAAAQLEKIVPVIQAACEQDRWPANVVACMADSKVGDMAAFQACANQLSPELQQKVQQRLTAALQLQPPAPPVEPTAPSGSAAAPSGSAAAPSGSTARPSGSAAPAK